jgi:hypothetical protein
MASAAGWMWLALNIVAAVTVVFVNKAVFAIATFSYPVALSCLHTVATYAAMLLWRATGHLDAPSGKLPATPLLFMACLHAGYLVLSTLSLALNTVSFYQVRMVTLRM